MYLADIGTQRVRAQAERGYSSYASGHDEGHDSFGGYRAGPPAAFGFTSPTLIYDQMRRMDLDATSLDTDFRVNVADPGVRQAWSAWFRDWKAFFDKTLTTSGKIANVFASDDLRETVNSRDAQLAGFHHLYSQQLTASGQPVPPAKSPGPPIPLSQPGSPPPPPPPPPWSFPWWGYVLGAAALGGIGYSFYRAHQKVRERAAWGERYLSENVVPRMLPGSQPMPLAMQRDPGGIPTQSDHGITMQGGHGITMQGGHGITMQGGHGIMMPVHFASQPALSPHT